MSNNNVLSSFSVFRRELTLLAATKLKELGFGKSQMIVLYQLSLAPASMGELSDHLQSDPSAATRTVAALKKAGWVRSASDHADRRRTLIELTAKGRKKAVLANELRNYISEKLEETLTLQEQNKLAELLTKSALGLKDLR